VRLDSLTGASGRDRTVNHFGFSCGRNVRSARGGKHFEPKETLATKERPGIRQGWIAAPLSSSSFPLFSSVPIPLQRLPN